MPAPILGDLVYETSVSTGAGNLTIAAVAGKQRISELLTAFSLGFGDNGAQNPIIFISNIEASPSEWEVVQCYLSDANTLVRSATPIKSSNANATVTFSAGQKDITNFPDADSLSASIDNGLITGAVTLSEDYGRVA